ncbi:hypothetical protein [Rhodocaloribacter sp.]
MSEKEKNKATEAEEVQQDTELSDEELEQAAGGTWQPSGPGPIGTGPIKTDPIFTDPILTGPYDPPPATMPVAE